MAGGSLRQGKTDEELLRAATDLRCNPTEEVPLPCLPEAVRVARRLTWMQLHNRWMLPPTLADDAGLLVSELVTNVLEHVGSRSFGFRLSRRRGWVRAEVRDPSRALPCVLPHSANAETGRGLHVVNAIAERWGVDLLPLGKSTWFEMRAVGR